MEDEKTAYFEYFKKLLKKSYLVLRESKTFPKDKKWFIEGFMEAGRILNVGFNELKAIIDEEHFKVFEMSIEDRRKAFKETALFGESYYDILTWVHEGKTFLEI